MAEDGEKDLGFKIEDKRRFDASGNARDSAEEEGEREPRPEATEPQDGSTGGGEEFSGAETETPGDEAHRREQAGELTFSSFVVGLASQAFMFLGLAPDPPSGAVHQDLGQAKAMIDILSMLEVKTAGNLDEDESRMMEEMLYELRLQYVKAVKGGGRPPQEETR